MRDEEFKAWLDERGEELARLNEEIKDWRRKTEQAPAEQKESEETWKLYVDKSGGSVIFRRMEERFVVLSEVYLETTPEQRLKIRKAFDGLNALLGMALSVPGTLARHIKTEKDVGALRIALAAASIQNSRIDVRDLIVHLDEVYAIAQKAGIDPQPHFNDVGKLSSRQPSSGSFRWSVCDLLCNHHRRFEKKRASGTDRR